MSADAFLLLFIVWLFSGIVAGAIASGRNRSFWGFFAATFFFLGPLGVGFALLAPRGELDYPPPLRPVAAGRRRFTCPRCGAHNDIPDADTSYDCWRCSEHRKVTPGPARTAKGPPKQSARHPGG